MTGVPQNVLSETYLIKYGNNCGTCFRICIDSKHYLITAKHNAQGIQNGDRVAIFYNNDWRFFNVTPIMCENESVDIIALETEESLKSQQSTLVPCEKDFYLGQDVFLVGFPERYLGLNLSNYCQVNNGYPIPFAKKCIISSFGDKNGIQFLCLDTVANKGFSGGPVFRLVNDTCYVYGVITKHLFDLEPVLDSEEKTQDYNARIYSGISYAHNIGPIIKAIKTLNYAASQT
jgi:hypothetical protein